MKSILTNTRRPDISFYPDGRIDITARIAKELDLRDGDVIDIAIDGEEYLLYRKYEGRNLIGKHEGQVHVTKKCVRSCNNLRTYSKRLCAEMIKVSHSLSMKARLPIGTPMFIPNTCIKAVPIIYKRNLA